ncbi:MAG: ATP-binding protein [Clostridia bacterium]|nr:ATP-binding protein [Clostridia bacterium]
MKKAVFSGIFITALLTAGFVFLSINKMEGYKLLVFSVLLVALLSAFFTYMIAKINNIKSKNSKPQVEQTEDDFFKKDICGIEILKRELNSIMNNYRDGILIFDEKLNCIFINNSLKKFLGKDAKNIKYNEVFDDEKFEMLVLKASNGQKDSAKIEFNEKIYQCTSYLLDEKDNKFLSMISIRDISAQEESDSVRVEFSANVSHELKTPLTSIMGNAEIIEMGIAKEDDIRNIASNIRSEAERLLNLIDDVINISKLSDKEIKQSFEEVFIDEIAREVINTLKFSAGTKNIKLNLDSKNISLSGNRHVIYEMFYNLVDNAISYGRENGTVNVRIYADDKGKHFEVKDNGIGIAKEEQKRIFERFYRVDKSRSKSTGGTGLGLSIVKHGSLMHGAEISLESAEGKGTKIDICFKD